MHDKPQIQNNDRGDASAERNSETESRDINDDIGKRTCICGEVSYSVRALSHHKRKCEVQIEIEKKNIQVGLANGTLIKCHLCDEIGQSLALHVRKVHGIDKKDYIKKYGPVLAPASLNKYSKAGEKNGDWINRAKESGQDLTEYWKKVSTAVSQSIMNSPEERERRAKLLGSLNKTEAFRNRSSETAKKTSMRKDVIEKRSEQLKRWREGNPEHFKVCIKKMHTFKSKPESELFEKIKDMFPELNFSNSQFIYSKEHFKMTKFASKQVDIISESGSIAIEFDGKHHFKAWDIRITEDARKKDIEYCNYILDTNKILIRVSYDKYSYRTKPGFSKKIIQKIKELIEHPEPGIHFVGNSWNEREYTHITSVKEVKQIYGV